MPTFIPQPNPIEQGGLVTLIGNATSGGTLAWQADAGRFADDTAAATTWDTTGLEAGLYTIRLFEDDGRRTTSTNQDVEVMVRPLSSGDTVKVDTGGGPMTVSLQRSDIVDTVDQALWPIIRHSVNAISFEEYQQFVDPIMCGHSDAAVDDLLTQRSLPFPDINPYRVLKAATEVFLMTRCGVMIDRNTIASLFGKLSPEEQERLGLATTTSLNSLWQDYVRRVNGSVTLPYLELVRGKLGDVPLKATGSADNCYGILTEKLTQPCFLELIWSYWHEEGMLVQTLNAISRRFQNLRGPNRTDPLANLELNPLRPLNNLFWAYIQDEQHRLTLVRRVYEYDHHYGLTLVGRAVPQMRPAESRSKFLEGFHTLLHKASIFYKEDDDTTMIADPFPVLNALRDVHLLLAEGAHNQWGDLPWTARHEMLMQQWLLARPEFRDFFPTRAMVVYPEPWMDRVDAMKRMQGWTDTSVRHFRDLAVTGEPILLSIRFGNWTSVINRNFAGNWARYWRQEVQWYIQAYQSVTGVDLSADTADVRGEPHAARFAQPAVHLNRRLAEQLRSSRREAMA